MQADRQRIRFCKSRDGARIAFSTEGSGPVLVRGPYWLSNLDADRDSPIWKPLIDLLSQGRTLVRYDHRGCGLSDRDVQDFSFDRFVEDFEAVVAAANLDRFSIFAMAGGASTAIAYAALHPARVDRLIALGGNVIGRLARARSEDERREAETQLAAIELGWGNDNPAFRQLFTSLAVPDGTIGEFQSFNEMIRDTVPPRNGAAIMRTYWNLDLGEIASRILCPTLVIHSRGDGRVPFEEGRSLAAIMPEASFIALESRNHIPLEREPAWGVLRDTLSGFLPRPPNVSDVSLDDLTAREREILCLVAEGIDNKSISRRVAISEKTVSNHITRIFAKIGVVSRAAAVAKARNAGLGV